VGTSPDATVVVPTRDRWPLLRLALRGALRQEGVNLEVVVVDDGSTDETPERLREFEDTRLRIFRNEVSRGVAASRNRGIAEARGEWVAFLDDDDVWSPRKLRAQLDVASGEDASFVYAAAVALDERRDVIRLEPAPDPNEIGDQLLANCVMPGGCSNAIARAGLLQSTGGFDPALSVLADWDLWIRLAAAGRPAACPEPLVGYLEHRANMVASNRYDLYAELDYLTAKHRSLSAARRVEFDRLEFGRWVASGHARAGRRFRAAMLYLAGALGQRDLGNLKLAVHALRGDVATPHTIAGPEWLALYR